MAEAEDDDLDLQPADAGALFRAEMWATNAMLGYWPYLVGTMLVVLVGFLFYGQYTSYVTSSQRSGSNTVFEASKSLDDPIPQLGQVKASGRLLTDNATLVEQGDALMAAANKTSGPSKVDGLLKAAEVFRVAEAPQRQREALEQAASEASSGGLLWYAAESGLANLDLEAGEGEAAIARLERVRSTAKEYFAQQATLSLGAAHEQLGQSEEALQVYEDFLREFSDSPLVPEVNQRKERVSG